jgi:hypothetical protein
MVAALCDQFQPREYQVYFSVQHFLPSPLPTGLHHHEKKGSSRISGKAIANTGFDKKNVVLA